MKKISLPISSKNFTKNSIIISSGLSITRNIDGISFPQHLSPQEKSRIDNQFLDILQQIELDPFTYTVYHINNLSTNELIQLSTDLMIQPHIFNKIQLLIAKNDGSWVFIPNMQDHLYIYSVSYGLCLKDIYKQSAHLFTNLDSYIHYAYSSEFGFTTSNINNVGNGLSCSILLNLYASELKGEISNLILTCQETGYSLTPYTSHPNSSLFLLKNMGSYGITEIEHIDHLTKLILQIQQNEFLAKEDVLNDEENKELLIAQINQTLSESSLSYSEASYTIGMIDFLDKKLYKIQNRQQWLEQLFILKDNSYKFYGLSLDEAQEYRASLLKSLFAQIVSFKRG